MRLLDGYELEHHREPQRPPVRPNPIGVGVPPAAWAEAIHRQNSKTDHFSVARKQTAIGHATIPFDLGILRTPHAGTSLLVKRNPQRIVRFQQLQRRFFLTTHHDLR